MVDSHMGLSPPIFVYIDLPAPSLQPEGRKFEWPDFGLTRPLNNDKRCAMLSKSSQVSPHGRWSRPGAKISTDQMASLFSARRITAELRRSWIKSGPPSGSALGRPPGTGA